MAAIIPTEIGVHTLRTEIPEKVNAEAVTKDLDMTDILHEAATVHIESYQQRLTNLYNKHVKSRDLVAGKFPPNWEGPCIIVRVEAFKSYAFNKLDGTLVPRMWNDMLFKRYY